MVVVVICSLLWVLLVVVACGFVDLLLYYLLASLLFPWLGLLVVWLLVGFVCWFVA